MKYCEYAGCSKEAVGCLSMARVRTYYCKKHLKSVKRKLVGI